LQWREGAPRPAATVELALLLALDRLGSRAAASAG
jgi:hypothetical protein